MDTTKFIAVSTQKGGGGKTTITELLASFFSYSAKKKVEVFDCDFPQYTIAKDRQDEERELELNDDKKQQWEKLKLVPYPIHSYTFDNCLQEMEKRLDDPNGPDYVFIDLPGTIKDQRMLSLISGLDHLFIPVLASQKDMRSSIEYAVTVKQNILGKYNLKTMHLFWNRFSRYSDNEFFTAAMALADKIEVPVLKTKVEESVKFNKGEFVSTLRPFQRKFFGSTNIISFIHEVVNIIK